MKMKCLICGGDCEKVGSVYKCIYCGADFEENDFAPKVTQKPAAVNNGAVAQPTDELGGDAIYAKVINSIARVQMEGNTSAGTSTGFLISSKGFVITNAHSVYDADGTLAKTITVSINGKLSRALPVAVGEPLSMVKGKLADLCLLWVDGDCSGSHVNTFGDYSEVKNGQREYIVGDPFGEGICITSGIVSDRARKLKNIEYPFLMTDAATNPGNSGGPHYNSKGEVIGVHVAGRNHSEGMNYAIPAYVAEAFITDVVNNVNLATYDFGELNKYRSPSKQSTADIVAGTKLILNVIDYIKKTRR